MATGFRIRPRVTKNETQNAANWVGLCARERDRDRDRLRRRLPLRDGVLGRLAEMDLAVHLSDPGERDHMMLAAGLQIALGKLDLIRTLQVIDGADVLTVGAEDFHVFLDALSVDHTVPPVTPGLTRALLCAGLTRAGCAWFL